MKKIFPLLIAAAIGVLGFTTQNTAACDCVGIDDEQSAFDNTGFIFRGTVTDIATEQEGDFTNRIEIETDTIWKGDVEASVTVWTSDYRASCGFDFEMGKTYIVYAALNTSDGSIITHACSGTIEDSPELSENLATIRDKRLAFLGEGKHLKEPASPESDQAPATEEPKDTPGQIFGYLALAIVIILTIGLVAVSSNKSKKKQ